MMQTPPHVIFRQHGDHQHRTAIHHDDLAIRHINAYDRMMCQRINCYCYQMFLSHGPSGIRQR